MALIVNVNRPKNKKPAQPKDFNPFEAQKRKKKKIAAAAVIGHLFPPELAAKWEELARLKQLGIDTGDWSRFDEAKARLQAK